MRGRRRGRKSRGGGVVGGHIHKIDRWMHQVWLDPPPSGSTHTHTHTHTPTHTHTRTHTHTTFCFTKDNHHQNKINNCLNISRNKKKKKKKKNTLQRKTESLTLL